MQQQRHLRVVLNDVLPFQKLHEVSEPFRLVASVLPRYAKDRRIFGMLGFGVRLDRLVEAESTPIGRPCRRCHPTVIRRDDLPMRTIVRDQLDGLASRNPIRELQDVADCRAPKAIQTLVLVADDADVFRLRREPQKKLLLDVVRVLVLIDHQIFYSA